MKQIVVVLHGESCLPEHFYQERLATLALNLVHSDVIMSA